jgi:hypothetical protein
MLTMLAGLAAAGLVECWKFTVHANAEINDPHYWQHTVSQPGNSN